MEDHKQSRTQPDAKKEEKILDLTKEMELADQEKHKIFDLTEALGQSEAARPQEPSTLPPPSEPAAKESTPSAVDAPAEAPKPAMENEAPPAEDASEMETTSAEDPAEPQAAISQTNVDDISQEPELTLDETFPVEETSDGVVDGDETGTIEDEVDAAFEEVQSTPPEESPKEAPGDKLFDKLSGITQMVDNAVREIKQVESPKGSLPAPPDDGTITSDAAELEAAISGEDEEEEIIELTEVVDPAEAVSAGELAAPEDDAIIDLVDIVEPDELSGVQSNLDMPLEPETVSQPDAPSPQTEEELALSDLEDFDPNATLEEQTAAEDEFDTAEIDNLFVDDNLPDEKETTGAATTVSDQEDEDDERVILLSDVLKEGPNAGQPSAGDVTTMDKSEERPVAEAEMETEGLHSASSPPNAKELEDLSNLDIEAAVEHLLKTKYADTIQRMVSEAVQKAITQEVENIKKGFSGKEG